MSKQLLLLSFGGLLLLGLADDSVAAGRNNKKEKKNSPYVQVEPGMVGSTTVSVKISKKKSKDYVVSCLNGAPGKVASSKKGTRFISFKNLAKLSRKDGASVVKVRLFNKLSRLGKEPCLALMAVPTPTPGPDPDSISMDPYTGPFGYREAQIFCDRFLFGCNQAELDQMVTEGLNATVARVTTYVPEPVMDAYVRELQCDGRGPDDPQNEQCDSYDPNDLYMPGVRYGWYAEALYSQNRFFKLLEFFLHNERSSVSTTALQGCEQHAIFGYLDMLKRAVTSGDMVQYCRDHTKGHFSHVRYLSGDGSSRFGVNEDYGREFLELACHSPTDLDGLPAYTDLDIVQSSLAMTGWLIEGRQVYPPGGRPQGYYVCYSGFFPDRHAPGPKTLFGGTPYQMTIYNTDDAAQQLFTHPHTAEAWARDLWHEYINNFATKESLQSLAHVFRDSGNNLLATMRTIMRSKAVYHPNSQKTLIKHPIEVVLGFIRQTGVPVEYSTIDSITEDMGQNIFRAPSVFGWDQRKLAGEFRVLDGRNAIITMMNTSVQTWTTKGFSFATTWYPGLESAVDKSRAVVDRAATRMGLSLNDTQKATLAGLMDNRWVNCYQGDPRCAPGQLYREERDIFDPLDYADSAEKMRNLLIAMATLPDYRVKN